MDLQTFLFAARKNRQTSTNTFTRSILEAFGACVFFFKEGSGGVWEGFWKHLEAFERIGDVFGPAYCVVDSNLFR